MLVATKKKYSRQRGNGCLDKKKIGGQYELLTLAQVCCFFSLWPGQLEVFLVSFSTFYGLSAGGFVLFFGFLTFLLFFGASSSLSGPPRKCAQDCYLIHSERVPYSCAGFADPSHSSLGDHEYVQCML